MTDKNLGGRPVAFENLAQMQEKIDAYFHEAESRTKTIVTKTGLVVDIPAPAPVHIAGLCSYLGITNETLNQYQKKEEFSEAITRAKQKCEKYAVDQCFEGQKGNKADFILNNCFGYRHRILNEIANKEGETFKTENKNLTDAELDARISELAAKTGQRGAAGSAGIKTPSDSKK